MTPERITDHIFAIRSGDLLSYAVKLDDGVALIDAVEGAAGALPSDHVRLICLTHAHKEHYADASEIARRSEARFFYHEVEDEKLPPNITASRYVRQDDVLVRDLAVVETPGHTPGHLSYYYRPEHALFSGDAIRIRRGRPALPRFWLPGRRRTARASASRALEFPVDILCPGRGNYLVDARVLCDRLRRRVSGR